MFLPCWKEKPSNYWTILDMEWEYSQPCASVPFLNPIYNFLMFTYFFWSNAMDITWRRSRPTAITATGWKLTYPPTSEFQHHHGLRKDKHGVREEWQFPVEQKLDELPQYIYNSLHLWLYHYWCPVYVYIHMVFNRVRGKNHESLVIYAMIAISRSIGTGSYCILPIVVCICSIQGIYSHFMATKNNAEHDVLKHGWLQPRIIRYCIWMWAPGIGLCRRRMLPRCWRGLVLAYVTPHGLCVDTRLQQLEIIRLAKHHATQVRKQKDIMAYVAKVYTAQGCVGTPQRTYPA